MLPSVGIYGAVATHYSISVDICTKPCLLLSADLHGAMSTSYNIFNLVAGQFLL